MRRAMVLLAAMAASSAALGFDFKGLEVGGPNAYTPEQVEEVLFGRAIKGDAGCGKGSNGRQVCNGVTSVGGVVATTNTVVNAEGVITRVSLTFNADSYDKVEAAVLEKFGMPSATSADAVQNRMGATFQNRTMRWERPDGRYIALMKYAGTVERGSLYFGCAEDTALLLDIAKPKKNDI